jgi:hypothetical protein
LDSYGCYNYWMAILTRGIKWQITEMKT